MFVELIDALRCPRPHEPTWLVTAAYASDRRAITAGALGCPICRATYPIEGGVARFDQAPRPAAVAPVADPDEDALRLAALLGLGDAGGIVAVGGTWDATVAPLLDALAGAVDVRVLVVEPAAAFTPREPTGALTGAWLPVAAGALRGVALDEATADPARLDAAVAALRPRGRLVAPAAAPVPAGVRELARDARHWVAERETGPAGAGPVVALRRAGR